MRKYEPIIKSDWQGYGSYENSFYAGMHESKSGEWVKLSTFNDTVAMLNAQIERLKKQVEDKEPDIKVGDKLRIIKKHGKYSHGFNVSDIVIVVTVEANNKKTDYIASGKYQNRIIEQTLHKDDFERVV